MADHATAHALDGGHRLVHCPLNLDHVANVDLSQADDGNLEGASAVMKYRCTRMDPPTDAPHARWAVGVYDRTTGRVDFKYVDGLPRSQMLKGIKCWPVTEIVTYGFDAKKKAMTVDQADAAKGIVAKLNAQTEGKPAASLLSLQATAKEAGDRKSVV